MFDASGTTSDSYVSRKIFASLTLPAACDSDRDRQVTKTGARQSRDSNFEQVVEWDVQRCCPRRMARGVVSEATRIGLSSVASSCAGECFHICLLRKAAVDPDLLMR